jgi:hypothetical protein
MSLYPLDVYCYTLTSSNLFTTVTGQVKSQNGKERDTNTWYYQVDSVKKSFASYSDVERDIRIRFGTTWIRLD